MEAIAFPHRSKTPIGERSTRKDHTTNHGTLGPSRLNTVRGSLPTRTTRTTVLDNGLSLMPSQSVSVLIIGNPAVDEGNKAADAIE